MVSKTWASSAKYPAVRDVLVVGLGGRHEQRRLAAAAWPDDGHPGRRDGCPVEATAGGLAPARAGSVSCRSRRAAIRARVNAMAAPGRVVVASKADSGNNIRMATVVGATVGANAMATITAPSTLTPTAAVGAAAATAAGRAA